MIVQDFFYTEKLSSSLNDDDNDDVTPLLLRRQNRNGLVHLLLWLELVESKERLILWSAVVDRLSRILNNLARRPSPWQSVLLVNAQGKKSRPSYSQSFYRVPGAQMQHFFIIFHHTTTGLPYANRERRTAYLNLLEARPEANQGSRVESFFACMQSNPRPRLTVYLCHKKPLLGPPPIQWLVDMLYKSVAFTL